jgi:hypothetical protein
VFELLEILGFGGLCEKMGAEGCCDAGLELRIWIVGGLWMKMEELSPRRGARRGDFLLYHIFKQRGRAQKKR